LSSSITYSNIWKIAYPIILGSAIQNIIRFTDTAFLGHVGEIELGAAAIGSVFYMTFMMLGIGYSVGGQIIVARRRGQNRESEIGKAVEHAFYFLILFAAIVISLLNLFLPEIYDLLISSENIYNQGLDYTYIRIWGLIFAFTNYTFRGFYIGIARTKIITITTAAMAIVNIFFDYTLIFGNWGFPEMGVRGAALASVIAEFAAVLTFILFTLKTINYKKYRLFQFQKLEFKLFFKVLNISSPVMMQNFLSFAGWLFFFLFVEKTGEHPLAISNIIRSIYIIMLIPIMGYSFSANSLVSYAMGKGSPEEVKHVIRKAIILCLGSVAVIVGILAMIPRTILSIFTDNTELIENSVPVLYVICGTSFLIGLGFVLFNSVSGTGNTKAALIIEASIFVAYVTLTYFLTIVWDTQIAEVWAVEFFYGGAIALSSWLFLKYYKWNKKEI